MQEMGISITCHFAKLFHLHMSITDISHTYFTSQTQTLLYLGTVPSKPVNKIVSSDCEKLMQIIYTCVDVYLKFLK